ncbi:MAG: CoA-binding protein [Bacteroidetes bacterium]|nr:CoA-binding protein [Bacteroidota bacterium]MCL5737326.1 CoA-binding protein [Bacteroidota bacterium]
MIIENDKQLAEILNGAKTIAVVGASPDLNRDSNRIMEYLIKVGYDVIPVNPNYEKIFDKKCFPTVTNIGRPIDIVDVFRRSEFADEVAKDAVAAKAKVIWMQLGVLNEGAAKFAIQNGLKVVMDRCIMVEHRRLIH